MARVLIVEDQVELAQIAAMVLERAGHEVRLAFHAAAALTELHHGHFDVALVDNVMPGGMDGEALVRAIRANPAWAELPLVAVTAKVLLEEQAAFRAAGVCDVVVKPYRAQALRDAVERALALRPVA